MPRPLGSQGRPGTQVIPHGWAAHHRPVVGKTFGADYAIRLPGGTPGAFDPETGTAPVTPFDPHATGRCRIQVLSSLEQEALSAGQEVTTVGYRVVVAYDAGVEPPGGESIINCLLTVTAVDDNGDPSLVGRTLTVQGIARGSLSWERGLTVTDDLG